MGGSDSRVAKGEDDEVTQALRRCTAVLETLDHTSRTLIAQETEHWDHATRALSAGDQATAILKTRLARNSQRDVGKIKSRRAAIERQKDMILEQQMNKMLTSVLVQTSTVIKSSQMSMSGTIDVIDDSTDTYQDVLSHMVEISEAITETVAEEEDEKLCHEDEEMLKALGVRIKQNAIVVQSNAPPPAMPPPLPTIGQEVIPFPVAPSVGLAKRLEPPDVSLPEPPPAPDHPPEYNNNNTASARSSRRVPAADTDVFF